MAHEDEDHRDVSVGGDAADTTDSTTPAWLRPPTTEPVDVPPPVAMLPIDEAPSLPAGGWFRRRSTRRHRADQAVEPAEVATPSAPEPVDRDETVIAEAMSMYPAPSPAPAATDFPPDYRDDEDDRPIPVKGGRLLVAFSLLVGAAAVGAAAWWYPTFTLTIDSTPNDARDRGLVLAGLTLLLVVGAVVTAGWRGLRTSIAMLLALAAIVFYVVPAIQDGHPAVGVALAAAVAITVVCGYLIHGLNRRAASAIVGTSIGLALVAGLGWATLTLVDIDGLSSNDRQVSIMTATTVLIAAGLLLDLTARQVDDVTQRFVASGLMTYMLVFVGAALSTLVALSGSNTNVLTELTQPALAVELTRVLTLGLAGLVALPITRYLAGRYADRESAADREAAALQDRVARAAGTDNQWDPFN